ncbi:MAG: UPF0158 family protein [Bacteroidia bacterium]|nr:UPF0158 family protein [Bacteroidia bacterium]
MTPLTQEQIKEIAEQLDCGFRCFWNKHDGELLFIPDTMKHPDMDTEAWSDEMEKLDDNFFDYKEIDQLESSDSFEIMADFVETLSDSNNLKNKLIDALNRGRPFRGFKFVIDNSGEYRQKWFDFKNMKMQKWVIDRFNEIINLEE